MDKETQEKMAIQILLSRSLHAKAEFEGNEEEATLHKGSVVGMCRVPQGARRGGVTADTTRKTERHQSSLLQYKRRVILLQL